MRSYTRMYKLVFDTNILISAALIKQSVSAFALDFALSKGRLVISESVMQEFKEVLFRKKFDKYFTHDAERLEAIERLANNALLFFPKTVIQDCRDPKDNKYIELAIDANASAIITGDKDLLILHPFRHIPILSATDFLAIF